MTAPVRSLLVLAAALALAAPAQAKEISKATIWGASGSVTIDEPDQLRLLPVGGPYVTDPPSSAPFYTIDVTADAGGAEHHVVLLYVPSAQRVASNRDAPGLEWYPVGPARAHMLDTATSEVEPYRASGWPPGLKSVEQISFLAGATVPERTESGDFPWTFVVAALLAAAAFLTACLAGARRRL